MSETEDYDKSATPAAHKTTHQDGGADEISVLGLAGLLADGQTPLAHKTSHQLLGADALSVAGLSGLLADDQHVLDAEAVSAMGTKANSNPLNHDRYADSEALAAAVQSGAITDGVTKAPTHDAVYDVKVMTEGHKTRHEDGGLDEISVAGLSGHLADAQDPVAHKTSHQDGGTDELSVAGLSGLLADPQTPIVQPKFSANKNDVEQTGIVSGEITKVTFETEEYDEGSKYDAANSKWVPGIVGKAHISASCHFVPGVDQVDLQIRINRNGAMYKRRSFQTSGGGGYDAAVNCDVLITAVTDYFEVFVYQATGSDKSVYGDITATFFSGHMLV